MLNHPGHPLSLRLGLQLFLFFFMFLALLGCHLFDTLFLFGSLLAQLLNLLLLLLVRLLLRLRRWGLFAVLLTLGSGLVRQLDTNDFVDDCEDNLEHFEGLSHRLVRAANFNFGPHEDGVLVVDLLVRNMQLKQTVAVLLKELADTLVDQLVRNLIVLSKNDEVVFLRHFTSLLLVGRRVGNRQVCSAHREQQSLEMVVSLHRSLLTRLLGEEELDWVRRRATVVATWEQDWNVHSEYVLGGGH